MVFCHDEAGLLLFAIFAQLGTGVMYTLFKRQENAWNIRVIRMVETEKGSRDSGICIY